MAHANTYDDVELSQTSTIKIMTSVSGANRATKRNAAHAMTSRLGRQLLACPDRADPPRLQKPPMDPIVRHLLFVWPALGSDCACTGAHEQWRRVKRTAVSVQSLAETRARAKSASSQGVVPMMRRPRGGSSHLWRRVCRGVCSLVRSTFACPGQLFCRGRNTSVLSPHTFWNES